MYIHIGFNYLLRIALSTVLSLVLGIEYYNLKPEVGSYKSKQEDEHDYLYIDKGFYDISVLGISNLLLLWLIIYRLAQLNFTKISIYLCTSCFIQGGSGGHGQGQRFGKFHYPASWAVSSCISGLTAGGTP